MIARVLGENEWDRLSETGNPTVCSLADPGSLRYVVVEDEGRILAAMAVLRVTHLENVWVSKDAGAGVRRLLVKTAIETARDWTSSWAMASIGDDTIGGYVKRLGGRAVPVDTYIIPLGG